MAIEALRVAAKESKVMKFVLGGFMFLAVGGLVFSSIGSYFTGNLGQTDVAKVGEASISLSEFDRDLNTVLQQTGMASDEAYESGIVNAYLNGRINNLLQIQAAQDLKIYPDNKLVAQQIQTMFGNMPRQQIESMMRAQGLTEQGLADTIRASILTRYINVLPLSIANYVPDFVEKADNKLQSERRSATVYKIPLTDIADNVEITDAQIQQYYQDNIEVFTTPESRSFTVGSMTSEATKLTLPALTEEDIQTAYEDQIDDFKVSETRNISQVVVQNPDIAQAIYEEALNGTALKDALVSVTEDTAGFREASSYQEDGLPAELADKAFDSNIEAGDVTPPVKTLVGYTIMAIESIIPPQQKPYAEVQNQLRQSLEQTQVYDALYNKMIETEDLIDAGQGFSDIAGSTGLKIEETESFTEESLINSDSTAIAQIIEASPAIVDELYSLPTGGVTYPLEIDDHQYVVIGVNEITEESPQALDSVRDDIITTLRLQNLRETVVAKLDAQLTENNDFTPPSSAITDTYSDIARSSDNEIASLIFSTQLGEYNYEITDDGYALIATVNNIEYVTEDENYSDEALVEQQRTTLDSLLNIYFRQKFDVTVNEDLLRNTYTAQNLQ